MQSNFNKNIFADYQNQKPKNNHKLSNLDTTLVYIQKMSRDELKTLKKQINKQLRQIYKSNFNKSKIKKCIIKVFPWLIVTFAGYMLNKLLDWCFSIDIINIINTYLMKIF